MTTALPATINRKEYHTSFIPCLQNAFDEQQAASSQAGSSGSSEPKLKGTGQRPGQSVLTEQETGALAPRQQPSESSSLQPNQSKRLNKSASRPKQDDADEEVESGSDNDAAAQSRTADTSKQGNSNGQTHSGEDRAGARDSDGTTSDSSVSTGKQDKLQVGDMNVRAPKQEEDKGMALPSGKKPDGDTTKGTKTRKHGQAQDGGGGEEEEQRAATAALQDLASRAADVVQSDDQDTRPLSEQKLPVSANAVQQTAKAQEEVRGAKDKRTDAGASSSRSIDGDDDGMLDRFGSVDIITGKPIRDLKLDPVLQLIKWRQSLFGSRDSVSESLDKDDNPSS